MAGFTTVRLVMPYSHGIDADVFEGILGQRVLATLTFTCANVFQVQILSFLGRGILRLTALSCLLGAMVGFIVYFYSL